MVNKKQDPNYKLVAGYIPVVLDMEFRAFLARRQLSLNSGIEEAFKRYIADEQETVTDAEIVKAQLILACMKDITKRKMPSEGIIMQVSEILGINPLRLNNIFQQIIQGADKSG